MFGVGGLIHICIREKLLPSNGPWARQQVVQVGRRGVGLASPSGSSDLPLSPPPRRPGGGGALCTSQASSFGPHWGYHQRGGRSQSLRPPQALSGGGGERAQGGRCRDSCCPLQPLPWRLLGSRRRNSNWGTAAGQSRLTGLFVRRGRGGGGGKKGTRLLQPRLSTPTSFRGAAQLPAPTLHLEKEVGDLFDLLPGAQIANFSPDMMPRRPHANPFPPPGQKELEEAGCLPGGEPATSPRGWAAPAGCAPSPPASASGLAAELLTAYLIGGGGNEPLGPNGAGSPTPLQEGEWRVPSRPPNQLLLLPPLF